MDVAERYLVERVALQLEVELQVLPGRDADGDGTKNRPQDRGMKNREQQRNDSESDEQPADPTSVAVRLDSAFAIVAHE